MNHTGPFGGPDTYRDHLIRLHEPFQEARGELMCRRCIVEMWPCPWLRDQGITDDEWGGK